MSDSSLQLISHSDQPSRGSDQTESESRQLLGTENALTSLLHAPSQLQAHGTGSNANRILDRPLQTRTESEEQTSYEAIEDHKEHETDKDKADS
ncbi:hypothetical protein MPH_04373 [Macrophomina phaseolina MS6]|uniref:Uncharacterized protein n=1 Tax=Macrophomina phaseolina (strain MS6) TaxID=1126212 RepID=K2S065_MACPH|nr:hypothetical protein MPH_04373 [Macrophomina phaseolina MS6]